MPILLTLWYLILWQCYWYIKVLLCQWYWNFNIKFRVDDTAYPTLYRIYIKFILYSPSSGNAQHF